MDIADNATRGAPIAQPRRRGHARGSAPVLPAGVALGALGVLGFSFSLPATKLAVADLDPWFVAFGRAAAAAVLAVLVLTARRARRPSAAQWRSLALVAVGVVVGFPLCTSLALEHRPAGQSVVVVALLPAATAVMATLLAGERPGRRFWAASGAGLVTALVFAGTRGAGGLAPADGLLLLAIVVCALGYAEGGKLARDLGGTHVICWALVLALPVSLTVTGASVAAGGASGGGPAAWSCFAYLALISMFLAFFAWYAGLARGGVARVGQVQLAQPVLTLGWAALVLGEHVGGAEAAAALAILGCVVATQRAR
ncbi:MAG: family transporter [Solirubrobacterales bacterium]|nr:family transporter [Solirubrobacterales bacterium]